MAAPPAPPLKFPVEVLNMVLDEAADTEHIIEVVFDRKPRTAETTNRERRVYNLGISMRGLTSISSIEHR
jgi:hypothetical protein